EQRRHPGQGHADAELPARTVGRRHRRRDRPRVSTVGGMRWRKVFRGEDRQLGAMRRWLASLLSAVPARDDVTLVATELASNAICHTASGRGGGFTLELTWGRSAVRVGVADVRGA